MSVTFYTDPDLVGHAFLRPSIAVGHGYQRIFSKVEKKGCAAFGEVLLRTILFVVLPILAVLSSLLILPGLVVKSLHYSCVYKRYREDSPPHTPVNTPHDSDSTSSDSSPERMGGKITITESPHNSPIRKKQGQEYRKLNRAAWKKLKEFRQQIPPPKTPPKELVFEDLQVLYRNVKGLHQMKSLLKNTQYTEEKVTQLYYCLLSKLDLLISSAKYYAWFHATLVGTDNGSYMLVNDNGDCWLEAFFVGDDVNIQEERKKTVTWIEEHFEQDEKLQDHLKQSFFDHLQALALKYKDDISSKETAILLLEEDDASEDQIENARVQLASLRATQEKNNALLEKMNLVISGQAVFKLEDIASYLEMMRKPGTFGGAGELYALSQRFKKPVHFHKHSQKNECFSKDHYLKLGEEFDGPPIKLAFDAMASHYNRIIEW